MNDLMMLHWIIDTLGAKSHDTQKESLINEAHNIINRLCTTPSFVGHPFTCDLCPWGRDGKYHDKPEYDRHMAHAHPNEWFKS